MHYWLYCGFWSLAPGWCFPTISFVVQPSPGENSTVTIPDGKIITIGCRNYMPLSHNQNIVLFSKNTSARRPLSPSLTVQCLDTREEKYIALFPLFSVLTWMTGSRLHNRRQKEKDHRTGMEMWNTSNGILFFFFFSCCQKCSGVVAKQARTGRLSAERGICDGEVLLGFFWDSYIQDSKGMAQNCDPHLQCFFSFTLTVTMFGQQFAFFSSHLRFIVKLGKIGHVIMYSMSMWIKTFFFNTFLLYSWTCPLFGSFLRGQNIGGIALAETFCYPSPVYYCVYETDDFWNN